jgi:hypothetical protein
MRLVYTFVMIQAEDVFHLLVSIDNVLGFCILVLG